MNSLDDNDQALRHAAETLRRRREFKRAMERGDISSGVWRSEPHPLQEPVSFIHPECSECSDPLYHENRSGIQGICVTCLALRNAKAIRKQWENKQATMAKQTDEAIRCVLWLVAFVVLVIAIAAGMGWVAGAWK